jgi:DNA-binding XRE family transcriptional regulator
MTTRIRFDAGRLGSDDFRRLVEAALGDLNAEREAGLWDKLGASALWPSDRPAVLVGDLHRLIDSTEWTHWTGLPPGTFAVLVIRTQKDAEQLLRPDVALRLSESRLLVLDVNCAGRGKAREAAVVRDYFRNLVSLLEPERVLFAKLSILDCVLWIQFGDGLERAVRWDDLPFARRLDFPPVAATAGPGGESVMLVDETGRDIEISAGSLRAFFDEECRSRLEAKDRDERKLVGARIRIVRESAGLSQEELSRRSGIAQESLSRIETGRRDPRLGTLQRLAKGLDLSLEQLMARLSAAA